MNNPLLLGFFFRAAGQLAFACHGVVAAALQARDLPTKIHQRPCLAQALAVATFRDTDS